MLEQDTTQSRDEDASAFDRRFKYAVCAYACIEFIALLVLFYYKYYRRDI